MNRRIRAICALLCLFTLLLPMVAQAEWVQKEIRWTLSGVTGDGANIYIRDTSKVVFGGGTTTLDTTGSFSIPQAQPMPRGIGSGQAYPTSAELLGGPGVWGAAYLSDTTVAAYLVFQADSTAPPTATLTSATFFIDGRVGGFGNAVTLARGWVKTDSLVIDGGSNRGNLTLGDESFAVPIRTVGVYGSIFKWSQLRARISAATGVLSGCRAFIRYWRPTVAGTGE